MGNVISEYLRSNSSHDHPIKGCDLASHFDITGVKVRKAVNDARCSGIPICASSQGYFYSDSKEQIKKTIESMRGRIISQENAIAGLESLVL